MQNKDERQLKVCVLGDGCVGKSCIARRFVQDKFVEDGFSTVGASYIAKTVDVESQSYKVQIWDTAGQEQFRALAPMYYRGAAAAIITFSIIDEKSFLSVDQWIKELQDKGTKNMLMVLVGNKSDLHQQRTVALAEIESFVQEKGIKYFETSAKTGENVTDTFHYICRNVPESLIRASPLPHRNLKLSDSSETVRRKKKCCQET